MIDVEAIQVKKYAVENPNEDLDAEQAGQEPSLPVAPPIGDVVDDAAEGQKRPTLENAFESPEARHVLASSSQSLLLWMMLWILQMNVPRKPLGWKNHHVNSK